MENSVDSKDDDLKWHPAFLQAVQSELYDYRDVLEFRYEFPLTSEPLRIDVLIIKKKKNIIIDKNIARIFRKYNIVEYKSPGDYLSVKDFMKVCAYANLYAAITPHVDLSGVTLTFVEGRYPRKLIQYLTGIRQYKVEETSPGIYIISGDYIPIQIIESGKLSSAENLWLKSLAKGLEIPLAAAILEADEKRGHKLPLDAYLDVLVRANPEIFLEVYRMRKRSPTFEEVFTKAGIIPEWIERGVKQGLERGIEQGIERGIEQGIEQGIERGIERGKEKTAKNLLGIGMPMEMIAQVTELPVEKIRVLSQK